MLPKFLKESFGIQGIFFLTLSALRGEGGARISLTPEIPLFWVFWALRMWGGDNNRYISPPPPLWRENPGIRPFRVIFSRMLPNTSGNDPNVLISYTMVVWRCLKRSLAVSKILRLYRALVRSTNLGKTQKPRKACVFSVFRSTLSILLLRGIGFAGNGTQSFPIHCYIDFPNTSGLTSEIFSDFENSLFFYGCV